MNGFSPPPSSDARLYFHEVLDLVRQPGTHTRYLDHLREVVESPRGNAEGGVSNGCVAAWAPVFLTGRWPEICTFWEMQQGWDGFAAHFDRDPALFHKPLELFYGERSGGFDRVLVAADYSIERADALAGRARASFVLQQTVTLAPGGSTRYLEQLGQLRTDVGGGARLIGAYEVAFRSGSEVIVLWGFDDMQALCRLQADPALDAGWLRWQRAAQAQERTHTALVLRPTPWSPLH